MIPTGKKPKIAPLITETISLTPSQNFETSTIVLPPSLSIMPSVVIERKGSANRKSIGQECPILFSFYE